MSPSPTEIRKECVQHHVRSVCSLCTRVPADALTEDGYGTSWGWLACLVQGGVEEPRGRVSPADDRLGGLWDPDGQIIEPMERLNQQVFLERA